MPREPLQAGYYQEESIDFRYYLGIARSVWYRFYPWILIANLLGISAAYLRAEAEAPSYSATVALHVAPKDQTMFNLEQVFWGNSDSGFKDTQVGILRSNKLLRAVVQEVGLHKVDYLSAGDLRVGLLGKISDFVFPRESEVATVDEDTLVEWRAQQLQETMSIYESEDQGYSNLLYVQVIMADPVLAAETANAVASIYVESVFENELETALKNQTFLTERLTVLRRQLRQAEQELADFMESEDIVARASGQDDVDTELNSLTASSLTATQERSRLENLVQQARSVQQGGTNLLNVPGISSQPMVNSLYAQVLELEQRKSELSKRYGKRHNRMIAIESELTSARRALNQQLSSVLRSMEAELSVARRAEANSSAALDAVRDKKQSVGRKSFRLNELQQDIAVKQQVYTAFLEKLNRDDAAGPIRNTNVWIADPATEPREGTSVSIANAIVTAALVCTLLSFGLGVGLVVTNNTLQTEEDVTEKAGAAVLGIVPLIPAGEVVAEGVNRPLAEYLENLHSTFAEAIRSVRTTLMLRWANRDFRKILVTSSETNEGKTSISLALSASLGQTSRVLLIDADLRRPAVEKAVSDDPHHKMMGVVDVLAGGAALADCVFHYAPANIDVLPAGSRSLQPLELIGSTGFAELLNEVSDSYDFIVIDSPPCSAVSDAYLLGSLVDMVAFVVKANATRVSTVRDVLQKFRDLQAPVGGIVLNQIDLESKSYPSYQSYQPYYGAYGAEETPVKLNEAG